MVFYVSDNVLLKFKRFLALDFLNWIGKVSFCPSSPIYTSYLY